MMKEYMDRAQKVLKDWKGDSYTFGENVLEASGDYAKGWGKKALLVVTELGESWIEKPFERVKASLEAKNIVFETAHGAGPNAPREDVYRISLQFARSKSDMIIALGGGSTIDAAKAAAILNTYSPSEVMESLGAHPGDADSIEPYFGTGMVTKVKERTGRSVLPVIPVQTAASSGAHLTKYSNITDPKTNQKKLIVDEAILPPASVFDYTITLDAPVSLTLDGGLDGVAHAWEVLIGTKGAASEKMKEVAELCIRLIVYLGSFSLIDILSHGRACALLNPYYTVLFAPVIQDSLRLIGPIFKEAGYIKDEIKNLSGRDLGLAVANGMISFARDLNFPTTLKEAGATQEHLHRMLAAAKNPQLKMKLQNMPTPMDAEKGDLDRLMKPVLEAAFTGDLRLIP
jgi:alcohol dehydrogenase